MALIEYTILNKTYRLDETFKPIAACTFTFMNGPCDGQDMVLRWPQIIRVDGAVIPGWQIRPWEPNPIVIRAFQLMKMSGPAHQWMMVGNNFMPDAQVRLGAGETKGWWGTPEGTGVPFPGINDNNPLAYFDLHGLAYGGGVASYQLDIIYTPLAGAVVEPPPPPPPPPEGSTGQTEGSAPGASTTPGFVGSTWFDRSYAVNNSVNVYKVGFYSTGAATGAVKIGRRTAAGQFEVIASESISHPGGGWHDVLLPSPVAIAASGEFYAGAFIGSGASINYGMQPRSQKGGDVIGTASGFAEDSSVMFATRVTY